MHAPGDWDGAEMKLESGSGSHAMSCSLIDLIVWAAGVNKSEYAAAP